MSATLYVVGTPIGNLKDITLRALDTLKNVDLIACEDTRHTKILLNAYGISKPLISCYREKESESAAKITEALSDGKNVALVSDAGMPAVSDPGATVVNECISKGFRVESVPGPSAVVTAFSVSGICKTGFVFLGFLPDKAGERKRVLELMPSFKMPVAVYVAPHDVDKILPELKAQTGIGRISDTHRRRDTGLRPPRRICRHSRTCRNRPKRCRRFRSAGRSAEKRRLPFLGGKKNRRTVRRKQKHSLPPRPRVLFRKAIV